MNINIELKQELTANDLSIIKNLYMPIIGVESIAFYELLVDEFCNSRDFSILVNNHLLASKLGFQKFELDNLRSKLEAVGLVRTFSNQDDSSIIISLNKPLSPLSFKSNSLLFREYLKVMPEEVFERFTFSSKFKILNKDNFREISVKFQDIFVPDFSKINSVDQVDFTMDIQSIQMDNLDEAIGTLGTQQFATYLTKKRLSPSLLRRLQDLQQTELSSSSINEIVYYSFKTNGGQIVGNHVLTIAQDLIKNHITTHNMVKIHLEDALDSKENKVSLPQVSENQMPKKSDLDFVKQVLVENIEEEVIDDIPDWEKLFESVGGF